MTQISDFTLHNNRGQSVLAKDLLNWVDELNHPSGIFGPVIKYSWVASGQNLEFFTEDYWKELPDASGFICFERGWKPNNCVLLDVYGKERIRLTVPWQMTGAGNDDGAAFGNIDGPYPHPKTGKMGEFGVNGWVGNHKFYFELDYHTGQFLWCRPIRD